MFSPKKHIIRQNMPTPQIAQPTSTLPVWAPSAAMSPAVVKIPPPMVEPIIMAVSLVKDRD